jgi:hypothetical protein
MTRQKNNQDKCDKSKVERPGPTKKQNSKYTNLSPWESKEATYLKKKTLSGDQILLRCMFLWCAKFLMLNPFFINSDLRELQTKKNCCINGK